MYRVPGRVLLRGRCTAGGCGASGSSTPAATPPPLFFGSTAAALRPHAAKKKSEDAYFIAASGRALGIADGVGSWAMRGVDAGLYSRRLMSTAEAAVARCDQTAQPLLPMDVLQAACAAASDVTGSATAAVVTLTGDQMGVVNVGDCSVVVYRGMELMFRTTEQQHRFNYPYQLSGKGCGGGSPMDGERAVLTVDEGDVVLMMTDGVLDNVEICDLYALMGAARKQKTFDPQKLADAIVHEAFQNSVKTEGMSPYSKRMEQQHAGVHEGGKQDDITVVVAAVTEHAPRRK